MNKSLAMNDPQFVNQEIVKCSLSLKSLIQDIQNCEGPLEKLNELNALGRSRLTRLKELIDRLRCLGQETLSPDAIEDAKNHLEQYYNTFSLFRKANVTCMLAIEKANKEELFHTDSETSLRHRVKKDKANMVQMSSGVTEQLLSISRHLADTTQLSADTLQTLANSSLTVNSTSGELQETRSAISQSGKLLAKYSRRQFTDKLLLLLGFAFFMACVLYILKKRLL